MLSLENMLLMYPFWSPLGPSKALCCRHSKWRQNDTILLVPVFLRVQGIAYCQPNNSLESVCSPLQLCHTEFSRDKGRALQQLLGQKTGAISGEGPFIVSAIVMRKDPRSEPRAMNNNAFGILYLTKHLSAEMYYSLCGWGIVCEPNQD